MIIKRLGAIALAVLTAAAVDSLQIREEARGQEKIPARYAGLPEGATHCDPSLPIFIELNLLGKIAVGQAVRFEVKVESVLDPDLIKTTWVEYEVPKRIRRIANLADRQQLLERSGKGRAELGLVVPDETRYQIRARFVVQLIDGRTITQTAVRWIDLGDEDPPEGMIGRIISPDGTGIRVYNGATVRN
jgi:hypothetical protein